MGTRPEHQYFPLLDGIRGLAAIAVMFRHMQLFGLHSIGQSYLGVDVFFALSGAVVASAYERKLLTGLTAWDFFWIRWRRLWPMCAIGVALGVANALWGVAEGSVHEHLWLYAAMALILAGDSPFTPMVTFNRPSWTMTFEFLVNIFYALVVRHLTGRWIVAICALCAAVLVVAARTQDGLDTGDTYSTLIFGAARTGYAFFMGVGLYRLYRAGRLAVPESLRKGRGAVLCVGLLALCLFAWSPHSLRWVRALLAALVLVPAIVSLGLVSRIGGRWISVCVALGALSYPLYLIHDPLGMLVAGNLIHHGHADLLVPAFVAFVPGVIALAWAIHYWVDEPFRTWLGGHFRRRALSPIAAAAE